MEILLIENVRGLGVKYETVKVPDGFANNNLIPKKLALQANTQKAQEILREQKSKATKKSIILSETAEKISLGEDLKIALQTNDKGSLYKAVKDKDISEIINKNYEVRIKPKDIKIEPYPVKETGKYVIKINVGGKSYEKSIEIIAK